MNVLITSASRKVWLIEAFRKALSGTGQVIAADMSLWAAAMHRADRALVVPASASPDFIDTLLQLCLDNDVGLLVPTRDEELILFASAAERFADIGTMVHVSPPDAVATCMDKWLFHEFCVERGFPVAAVERNPSASDLPLFVRPRRGRGSVGIGRIDRPDQLEELAGDLDEIIFNHIVEASEYTIDVFISRSGTLVSSIPRERVTVVAGESYVARTTLDPELADLASKLCLDIGLTGHNTVQAFRSPTGISFIEVNPRFGGGAALGFAAGAPTTAWLVAEARGEEIPADAGDYVSDLVMLRYTSDVFVERAALDP